MIFLTTYYNPCKYKTRKNNYFKFRKSLEKENLNLVTVELASCEKDFEIEDSIRFYGNPFLWQKECLLSKFLSNSKEEKIAWLDCDIVFENKNWHKELEEKLESYDVVQLFSEVNFLDNSNNIEKSFRSTFFEYYNNANFNNGHPNQGHPGFAFAAKRNFVNFYKKNFVFSGDLIYLSSIIKDFWVINSWNIDADLKNNILNWCEKNNNGAKFTYLNGTINHLWHGSWKNRQYQERMKLTNYYKQIKIKENFFECSEKVNKKFVDFFKKRNEDGFKLL